MGNQEVEEDLGIQQALAELARDPEPIQQDQDQDQPEAAGGQERESGGSAPGSIQPSSYYSMYSARSRVGVYKGPGAIESRDPSDLRIRFNGSKTALARYRDYSKKSVIIDKGFDKKLLGHALIRKMIREHQWTEFCTHHEEASNWELIREFYANMDIPNQRTWVRGVSIGFGPERLNEFLGTRNEEEPGYLTYEVINRNTAPTVGGQIMVNRVAHSMCGGPPNILENMIVFEQTEVRVEIKPSMDFYFSKIKPVSHMHRVSGVTLYGLSEIFQGRKLNVGKLIFRTLTRSTRGMLTYPNLIRRLCVSAGVDFAQFPQACNIEIGGPIPLIDWNNNVEFRYELMDLDRPVTPPPRAVEGEQSRMPTPTLRPRHRRRRQLRGRRRISGSVEVSVNQGDIPESSAAREQFPSRSAAEHSQMPSVAPSQGTQFTDISQTLVSMQERQGEQLREAIREMNEGRLRERELELKNQRELEEKRLKVQQEMQSERLRAEAERDARNQEFQLRMAQIMATLMPGASQLPQHPPAAQPPRPPGDQDPPPPRTS